MPSVNCCAGALANGSVPNAFASMDAAQAIGTSFASHDAGRLLSLPQQELGANQMAEAGPQCLADASDDLTDLTVAESGRLLALGEISPVELVRAHLQAIDARDPHLHAFITVASELALKHAHAAERRIANGGYLGGMDGIPFAVKDNIDTAGIRTTAHSKLLADNVPTEDAQLVASLARKGGILIGKTATFEFAFGGPSWDLPWPPALNPWSSRHLPGGSSSGNGAAVAGRLVPAAIGTDTGGSVRWPAAVCGIVGLKPTYGRVSRRGVLPNSFSLDHCGPMARTVEDCAILLGAIAGYDALDPSSINEAVADCEAALTGSVRGLRIGLIRHWYAEAAMPEVTAAVDAAVGQLSALGAVVEEMELAPLSDYVDCKTTISMAELFAIHENDLKTRPADYGAALRSRVLAGGMVRGEDYVQALRWRAELTRSMFAHFRRFDAFVTAGWLSTAEPNDPEAEDFFQKLRLVPLPFNLAGNPALVVPCGFSSSGLPISLQIAGKPFDEATVLRIGDAYQRSTAWHLKKPAFDWPLPSQTNHNEAIL
ncbi:amidase [Aminobacter aminovorans]|uniref:Indoleacetamide hydrolase n=2 Tax=Aminobacter aminovorans TaxID=83263 RepID=A0ABR6H398_AMIAI|nr:amidase [Aminobacter aminovorans]MBB3704962.1 aspartyl-tRNA(Asn)/glutamyl-tRNA(Gln) amidotransferase subunit A [Aminobacter aminovorans]